MEQVSKPIVQTQLIWVIGCLYLTQGIPMGVAVEALPALLRQQGYSTQAIGYIGLMMLPWALKFLWAPLVDRYSGALYGTRHSWIIPCQLILSCIFLIIAVLPENRGIDWTILSLLMVANIVSATQDIATDGLAIETIPSTQLNWVNSFQIGGFALGLLVGGGATIFIYDQIGWGYAFIFLSVLFFLTAIPVFMYRDLLVPQFTLETEASVSRPTLWQTLKRKHAFFIFSIAGLFYFGHSMAGGMTKPYLVDLGFTLSQIALFDSVGIASMALLGAPLGGLMIRKYGLKTTTILFGLLAAISILTWLVVTQELAVTTSTIIGIKALAGITVGALYVTIFTLFMRWSSKHQAGTDFTSLQCSESLTNIAAMILAGYIAGTFGYQQNYLAAATIAVLSVMWIGYVISKIYDSDRGL